MARLGVGERERRARRARIRPALRLCAAEAAAIAEPHELEAYGFRMLATATIAGAPRGVIEDAVAEIAAARRGRALIEAMAAAAAPPASRLAAAAARSLRAVGAPGSAAAAAVGSLRPVRAWSVTGGRETGVAIACRRPGGAGVQVLGVSVEAGGALLLDGVVTAPIEDPALLDGGGGAAGVEAIAPQEAVARAAAAARATLAAGRAPSLEAVEALVLLLRAGRARLEPVLAELHSRALGEPPHRPHEAASPADGLLVVTVAAR